MNHPRLSRAVRPCLLAVALALPLFLATSKAWASLPDPTRFGVVMELENLDQAQEWLDEGLPPDFLADRIGTGLMIGAWSGNIPMMELFLKRGANINQTNALGEQALQLAAWRGQTKALEWLLAHGATVNREGKAWSALHYAAFAGHDGVVKLLLGKGANINALAPNQSSVLMMAVREGHEQLVKDLLSAGADPRVSNDWGDTALTWAMRYQHLTIAKLVSSAQEFTKAVQAPVGSFGKPVRSAPAPAEVSEILRQIRIARSEGKKVDDLEKALFAMTARLQVLAAQAAARNRGAPSTLTITARRPGGQGGQGERAELRYNTGSPSTRSGGSATLAATSPAGDISEILYRLRRAEAEGKPVEELRQQLLDAVARMAK